MSASTDIAALEPWRQYAEASPPTWDWEAACVDGKLHRFGYCGGRVLVLVVTIHDSRLNRAPANH